MGTLRNKLQYTYDAVEDIESALQYHGINTYGIELKKYGDLIRSIAEEEKPQKKILESMPFTKDTEYAIESGINAYTKYAFPFSEIQTFLMIKHEVAVQGDNIIEIGKEE